MTNKIKASNLDTNAVTADSISYPLTTFSSTGIDDNATSTAITIDGSQNVGIGETSPLGKVHIKSADSGISSVSSGADEFVIEGSGDTGMCIVGGTSNSAQILFGDSGSSFRGSINYDNTDDSLRLITSASEAMRIDNQGSVLVNNTATPHSQNSVGAFKVYGTGSGAGVVGLASIARSGGVPLIVNRVTDDGNLVEFNQAGGTVGAVTSLASGGCRFNGGGAEVRTGIEFASLSWNPARNYVSADNTVDLGTSGDRFNDIYATNSTIQTSDANEKQSIQSLTTAEMNVAKRLSPLFKTFKWNSAVEEKGDSARTHTGIIAQDVQQAFADEGLDASNYALFISTTWWEEEVQIKNGNDEMVTDVIKYFNQAEAPSNAIQKNRLGIRFPELMAFIQAYNDQRFTELEARITALETT